MKLAPSEADIQRLILDWCKAQGILAWRVSLGASIYSDNGEVRYRKNSMSGFPDICACVDGRFVAIEVKAAKGRLSPHQKAWLDQLAEAGAACGIARSLEDAQEIVAEAYSRAV